jgi:hypothetical protein
MHGKGLPIDVPLPEYPNGFFNRDLQDKQLHLVPPRLGIGPDIFDTSEKSRLLFLVN